AHEMVVADGTLEAYEAYEAMFAQSRFTSEVHEWVVRRHKMVAWNEAVTINTAASYRAFLAQYPDTDLSATARTLIERLRYRPEVMPQVAALGPSLGSCTTPSSPPVAPLLKKADVAPAHDANAVVIKRAEVTPRQPVPRVNTPPTHRQINDEVY